MSSPWSRLLIVALVYAFAGWLGGAIITAKGGLSGLPGAMAASEAVRSALLAAGIGSLLTIPLLRIKRRAVGIVIGVLGSALTAVVAVWLYYAIWPPQWEAPAYKIAGMVLKGYWKHLVPLTIANGFLIGWVTTMPKSILEAMAVPEEEPAG